jgi:sRNA-binding carbon storage regulator CsrA
MATLKIKRSRARLHIKAPKSSKTTREDNEKYDITEMALVMLSVIS